MRNLLTLSIRGIVPCDGIPISECNSFSPAKKLERQAPNAKVAYACRSFDRHNAHVLPQAKAAIEVGCTAYWEARWDCVRSDVWRHLSCASDCSGGGRNGSARVTAASPAEEPVSIASDPMRWAEVEPWIG